MRWTVKSGDVNFTCDVPSFKSKDDQFRCAVVESLKHYSLGLYNELVMAHDENRKSYGDEMWALTVWYLEDAGYEKFTDNGRELWRKKDGIIPVSSSSKTGVTPKKPESASTSQPSVGVSTSKTVSAEPTSKDAGMNGDSNNYTKLNSLKSLKKSTASKQHLVRKVHLHRTPEEWRAILEKARRLR